jgi:NADH:ubiquinone oxidoreductase subunit 4 (subunit M)
MYDSPKIHVEAPMSMLLAAIFLKLDGYGLIQSRIIFIHRCLDYTCLIVTLGFIGIYYT